MAKECSSCELNLDVSNFNKRGAGKGKSDYCHSCRECQAKSKEYFRDQITYAEYERWLSNRRGSKHSSDEQMLILQSVLT